MTPAEDEPRLFEDATAGGAGALLELGGGAGWPEGFFEALDGGLVEPARRQKLPLLGTPVPAHGGFARILGLEPHGEP